jgi:cyclophilin family peptidyl-prolyl cis-trans isomerase
MQRTSGAFQHGARLCALAFCLVVGLCLVSCGGDGRKSKVYDEAEGAGGADVKREVKPEPDAEVAVLEVESGGVSYGSIVIELYPNIAPKMVERFKTLTREGFYNGTAFHRINPATGVVQGGDPNSKDDDPSNDGMGGSTYPDVPAEFSDIPFDRGTVGAARSQDVNSANSQFYITLRRVPQWDAQYTVFGKVIEGMTNAQIIAGAPTRPGSENPAEKIIIKSAVLQPRANFVH